MENSLREIGLAIKIYQQKKEAIELMQSGEVSKYITKASEIVKLSEKLDECKNTP